MKGIISTLAVAGTLLAGGMGSAQTTQTLPAPDTAIWATFYDGNPFGSGERLTADNFNDLRIDRVRLTDSSVGKNIDDVENADFIKLSIGEGELAFEVWGVTNTASTQLKGVNDGDTLQLGRVVSDLTRAMKGETNLAIFTDSDGVVTGFYTFDENRVPNVSVEEADYLVVAYDGNVSTLTTRDPGIRSLGSVAVDTGNGQYLTLARLASLNN